MPSSNLEMHKNESDMLFLESILSGSLPSWQVSRAERRVVYSLPIVHPVHRVNTHIVILF